MESIYFHLSFSEVGYMYICMYVYYNSVRINVACSYLDLTNFAFTSSIEELSRYFLQSLISSILSLLGTINLNWFGNRRLRKLSR